MRSAAGELVLGGIIMTVLGYFGNFGGWTKSDLMPRDEDGAPIFWNLQGVVGAESGKS